MSITWQMTDRDTLNAVLIAFDAAISPRSSNHHGVHLEGEGPTGLSGQGSEGNPVIFWIVTPEDPDPEVKGLGGTRGRRYSIDWQCWSEPAELERVFRDEGQQLLTFLDGRSDSGWTWFLEDAQPAAGVEYNADFAGRTLRVSAFAGAS